MSNPDGKALDSAFERLRDVLGSPLSFYVLCAVNDLPYIPECAENAEDWSAYKREIKKRAEIGAAFADGETDVRSALLAGLSQEERWKEYWGVGVPEAPYTEDDYRTLDETERNILAQFDSVGGAADAIQRKTAKDCAIIDLKIGKLVALGDKESIDIAAKLRKMYSDSLSDCNMRKKDILPGAAANIPTLIDAMKAKWGVGIEVTEEQAVRIFEKWCAKPKYPQTWDAADHMLLAILNTIQKNDDLPEQQELISGQSFAGFVNEFAPAPNDAEEEAYEYLGLVRGTAGGVKRDAE